MSEISDQMKLDARAFYQQGSWYLDIHAPRWFIEALDEMGVQFSKASSSYVGNSGKFFDAGILLRATMSQPTAAIKEQPNMEGLTEGRIVHYVMQDGNSVGQHRPAIIVNAWKHVSEYEAEGRVNLQVFTDFGNDGQQYESGRYWATSVPYSEHPKPGTWHWIERA